MLVWDLLSDKQGRAQCPHKYGRQCQQLDAKNMVHKSLWPGIMDHTSARYTAPISVKIGRNVLIISRCPFRQAYYARLVPG
jgi:hypothetical protein